MPLKSEPQALRKIDPQILLKVDSQTFFNIESQLLIKIDPRMLLKSWSTNVAQKVILKRYSKKTHQC